MGMKKYASCPEIAAIHTKSQNEFWKRVRKEGVSRLIKGSRFLLFANSENIVNHSGMSKLQLAHEVNKPLPQAYYLKEDFQAGIHSQTLFLPQREILAWYHGKLSTAKVEGINNKIKVMKRNAYGYRDDYYFTTAPSRVMSDEPQSLGFM